MRGLVISLLTASVLVLVAARGLARYAHRHYLPQQQMDRARAAGDGCLLVLGDSRMVAAFDPDALHRPLQAAGRDGCHAQLALGAIQVSGIYLTAREYLAQGRSPRIAVIGKVGDSLLGPQEALRPEEMVGNNAIHLIWSTPVDVFAEAPGFPLASVDAFDRGFRFLVARATSLGRYQSLVSARIQTLQGALVGAGAQPRNRFGALGDMSLLEDGLRARAPARLQAAMQNLPDERYGGWFRALADLLRARHIPMLIVELPMRSLYRASVTDTGEAIAYQDSLADDLKRHGDALLDLSRAPWVNDQIFVDELHLGGAGAALVSAEIGRCLATTRPASSGAASAAGGASDSRLP
jgi:hypothetical protein